MKNTQGVNAMKVKMQRTRREALAMLAALGVARSSLAQDAVTSDPRSFRVVLENERVRVLEFKSGPGLGVCGQGMHYHPDRVTVSLTKSKVRIRNSEGKVVIREIPSGSVFFAKAETHSTENIGGSGSHIYIIELKDKDWKPSTGRNRSRRRSLPVRQLGSSIPRSASSVGGFLPQAIRRPKVSIAVGRSSNFPTPAAYREPTERSSKNECSK
jgi:hypothetical protein